MKATQRDFTSLAQRAARDCKLFLFCGPDEAGAAAAANKLVALLAEPGERVDLSGGELKADPSRLIDEARSVSLFGGTRHLYVRAVGDEAHDAVRTFLEMADVGEARGACPVVICATSATDKSRTAKLMATRKDCLVAMFWPPDLASVTAAVLQMADPVGLRLGRDLAERIARGAGLDVRVAHSELTKLALYLDASKENPRDADRAALDAIGATTEEDGLNPLINAVLSGASDALPGELRRMREVGLNPVGVALALERRAAQLARLAARLAEGGDTRAVLDAERVFARERDVVADQLRRWNAPRLDRLVTRLAELHRSLLLNSSNTELLLSQALVQITRVAAGRASRPQ